MANPLLKINQPADVKLGQKGNLNLGIAGIMYVGGISGFFRSLSVPYAGRSATLQRFHRLSGFVPFFVVLVSSSGASLVLISPIPAPSISFSAVWASTLPEYQHFFTPCHRKPAPFSASCTLSEGLQEK